MSTKPQCRVCGCTNTKPCDCSDGNHCYWVTSAQDFCSKCRDQANKEHREDRAGDGQ